MRPCVRGWVISLDRNLILRSGRPSNRVQLAPEHGDSESATFVVHAGHNAPAIGCHVEALDRTETFRLVEAT